MGFDDSREGSIKWAIYFLKVTGKGYVADGIVKYGNVQVRFNSHPSIFKVIEIGAVCNNSHIYDQQVTGNPTEAALLTLAMKVEEE